MDSSLRYSYLIMGTLFFVIWLIIFIFRKTLRKEMLVMSIIFAIAGVIVEPAYVHDWWRPITITGTIVGFEDFLFGFAIGGISSVIYETLFKKRIIEQKSRKKDHSFIAFGMFFIGIFGVCFTLFSLNSFISSIIAFSIGIIIILISRKDLLVVSLVTAVTVTILASITYTITELITPGWVQAFWYFRNVPNIVIFNVPIDDIVWYFLAGAFIGPLYEFWKKGGLSGRWKKPQVLMT